MYYYIQTDENGLIVSDFQSTKEKSPEQTELIEVDAHDSDYCRRYYLNGEVGPAPRDGYRWEWNSDTSQFVEVPYPTE